MLRQGVCWEMGCLQWRLEAQPLATRSVADTLSVLLELSRPGVAGDPEQAVLLELRSPQVVVSSKQEEAAIHKDRLAIQ